VTGGKKKAEVGNQKSGVRSQKVEVGKKSSALGYPPSAFRPLLGSKPDCVGCVLPTALEEQLHMTGLGMPQPKTL
jgi:hypothetical protein